MKMAYRILAIASFLALACAIVAATDPDPLQDFCVSDLNSPADVNGQPCLDPNLIEAKHFYFSGLSNPGTRIERASHIVTVIEGKIQAGFVTSGPGHKLFTKDLQKGDVFVFPQGLSHLKNLDQQRNAFVISAFGSQNPGANTVADGIFGSKTSIPEDILAKKFQVDESVIKKLQAPNSRG